MAEGSESFQDGDHFGSVSTSFSQLLFSNDHDVLGLDSNQFNYFSSSSKPPKMLCFGGFDDDNGGGSEEGDFFLLTEAATKCTPQKSGVTCSDSSSASSINNNNNTINVVNTNSDVSKSSIVRKRNGKCQETVQGTKKEVKTDVMNQKACKKIKTQSLKSPGNAKGRKEKLGERIAALQQLVSPYGKTDTASVLHEAMGYIRFLHDQVQVLCSPYLLPQPDGRKSEEEDDDPRKDLRSRGLCLVPLESTIHVANSNGADYWSPAMRSSFTLSPSTMKCQ